MKKFWKKMLYIITASLLAVAVGVVVILGGYLPRYFSRK